MSCYSSSFEFMAGEAKKLAIQVNVDNGDCKEPIGIITPGVAATAVIQSLTFTGRPKFGDNTNLVSIEYVGGGTAGSEVVTVSGPTMFVGPGSIPRNIKVKIEDGVSTATQVKAALLAADVGVEDNLVRIFYSIGIASGQNATPQTIQGPTFMTGGVGSYVRIELPGQNGEVLGYDETNGPLIIDDGPLSKISVELTDIDTNQLQDGPIIVRVCKAGKMSVAINSDGVRQIQIPNC